MSETDNKKLQCTEVQKNVYNRGQSTSGIAQVLSLYFK